MFTDYATTRMDICRSCEHFNNIVKTCKLCGCFMPAKTNFKEQRCPDNPPRWTEINQSNYATSQGCCNKESK